MVCLHLHKVSAIRIIRVIEPIASRSCIPQNLITFFVLEDQVSVLGNVRLAGEDLSYREVKIFALHIERILVEFSGRAGRKNGAAFYLSALNPHR